MTVTVLVCEFFLAFDVNVRARSYECVHVEDCMSVSVLRMNVPLCASVCVMCMYTIVCIVYGPE